MEELSVNVLVGAFLAVILLAVAAIAGVLGRLAGKLWEWLD